MHQRILRIQTSTFNALAHPLRLKILQKLRDGPCCVCKIIPYVEGEQSNVSHHLAILRKANIVSSEKRGLEVWYEITDPKVFEIIDLMAEFVLVDLKKNRDFLESVIRDAE